MLVSIANIESPDQTAHEQSDLGLQCSPRIFCSKFFIHHASLFFATEFKLGD